ncbi:hypothetical protein ACFL01_04280, partial [Planctomycetota bacterium]
MRTRIAAVIVVISSICASAGALEVPVTVREPAGVARKAEPASGGIPLPAGRYKADQGFALFDGDKEVPLQALPLVVDENGFLRWILLDFQVDLGAGEAKTLTLKDTAPSAKPAKGIAVTETDEGLTVDTGAMTFTISKTKSFTLFDTVSAGGKNVL